MFNKAYVAIIFSCMLGNGLVASEASSLSGSSLMLSGDDDGYSDEEYDIFDASHDPQWLEPDPAETSLKGFFGLCDMLLTREDWPIDKKSARCFLNFLNQYGEGIDGLSDKIDNTLVPGQRQALKVILTDLYVLVGSADLDSPENVLIYINAF